MTTEEYTKLELELELASELYGQEFDKWYDFANYTDIESYCRTGWLYYRIKTKAINDRINEKRDQGPSATITGLQ